MYKRKTYDVWVIYQAWSDYSRKGYTWENVGEYENRKEAVVDLKLYRENQPNNPCYLKKERRKVKDE